MGLRLQIDEKYKSALKSKNSYEINTIRLIKSAIKNKDIENRTKENQELINDQQIKIVLQNLVKQRQDSIKYFTTASRNDLIEKEKKEIEIIHQFLPEQISKDEIETIIEKFISDNNISTIKDMAKIMSYLKLNYTGTIDMGFAGKIAKNLLGG